MKMILLSAFSVLVIFLAVANSQAAPMPPSACKDLVSEMNLLRKAQGQIINGLADNHEAMAKSMDDFATQLSFLTRPVPLRVLHNMKNDANAYHKRGQKGHEQALSLDEATADLANRMAFCLRK